LTRDGQIDFEIFQHELQTGIWLTENTHPFEEDPRTYGSYINDSVYLLLVQSTQPKETNIAHCLERMARIPAVIAGAPNLDASAQTHSGNGHPAKSRRHLLLRNGTVPIRRRNAATGQTQKRRRADRGRFEILPAIPGGRSDGARHGGLAFGPGEVFAQARPGAGRGRDGGRSAGGRGGGVRQGATRHVCHRAPALEPLLPQKPLPPDDAAGRRETITKVIDAVDQEHGKPEELVGDARATVENIKKFIREHDVLRLPEPDRCQVIEMPEFRRGNSVAYMDNAPPLDPDATSFYAVSPPPSDWDAKRVESFLEEYNHHMLQILTIHEAYPGHYVQLAYAARAPSLIRKVYQSGAYVEGWAVYGEQNMLDMGYGDGDLRLRLMQLKFYLRAVANAILDHKMHCDNMTDEEAMKMLVDDCFQSEGEARLKIIRAKQSSTQLSTYFVGRMGHYRLRQKVERELGDGFSIGRYHEAVISCGSVPLKYLPELVKTRLSQPR
jgi:hypothetical protein